MTRRSAGGRKLSAAHAITKRDGRASPVWMFLARHGVRVQWGIDSSMWAMALVVATAFRYDANVHYVNIVGLAAIMPLAVLAQGVAGLGSGLYRGRWRFGSFDEVAALVRTTVVTAAMVFVINLWVSSPPLLPRSVPVAGGVLALVLMAGCRYAWRLGLERRQRPSGEGLGRFLVFGAGEGGARVVSAMLRDPTSKFIPVGLLDDDPSRRNLTIMGVPVLGGRSTMEQAAAATAADTLLVAIPSAGPGLVTELTEIATTIGLEVKVLPPVNELLGGRVGVGDIRDVTDADLLGRHAVETDLDAIAGYLTGKRVLVTGAGGSIGSELCRQIAQFEPAELIKVDRDESGLHGVQLSMQGRALLDSPDLVLLDIRDRPAVERLLNERRPNVIFHAAALKHLPLLESFPDEAVKTNVWGTLDLLEAALAAGVGRFVNISTDKAADPCSVLGYSKRVAERLTSHAASRASGAYVSVRFGNVLGSRGSLLGTFHAQIDRGGPLTVTHPDVTRYFMTVQEAVQLVVQAGAIGRSGEVLVLDMGEAVRIADLARLLAERCPDDVAIEFTGLRPGEKLHEALLGTGEVDRRPVHPLIAHVDVAPLDFAAARAITVTGGTEALVSRLAQLSDDAGDVSDDAPGTAGGLRLSFP